MFRNTSRIQNSMSKEMAKKNFTFSIRKRNLKSFETKNKQNTELCEVRLVNETSPNLLPLLSLKKEQKNSSETKKNGLKQISIQKLSSHS